MKKLVILSFLIVTIFNAKAQNTDCKVLPDSLKGSYEGGCKNGKADGKGKATGVDIYDGEFKNGLPDGTGKYNWHNGSFYDGGWRKGMKDGKGELHTFENNIPSVKTGFWKKDKYTGLYETPYRIVSSTSDIGRVEVDNAEKNSNTITVTVKTLYDKTSASNYVPIIVMTDFQISKGSYETKTNTRTIQSDITRFRDVVFPFMASFNFGTSVLQIEIFEKGDWNVEVPITR